MRNTFSNAESYVAERIAATEVTDDPFAHCVVDDVFPPDLFAALHENWPSESELVSLPETGRTQTYAERYVMLFDEPFFSRMNETKREFWRAAADVAMGSEVVKTCCNKFQNILRERIKHITGAVELSSEMLVVSDRASYAIGPHTDSRLRFVSLLYYLSPDPKYKHYGTGLYQPKDPKKHDDHSMHYQFRDFILHHLVEYKPNRVVIFPRTDKSYHGVQAIDLDNCDRRLLIVNIRAPEGAR